MVYNGSDWLIRGIFMRTVFSLLIIVGSILVGCQNKEANHEFLYPNLLPEEEGTYSYVLIYPDEYTEYEVPDFMKGYEQSSKITKGIMITLEKFKEEHSEIMVNEAPYYLFLDTEGIVLETNEEDEAEAFYLEKIHLRK
jgi:hypothetical protein